MAQKFSELYPGDELKLRDGLDVLETHGLVEQGDIEALNLWVYGIVTDASILDYAKEALISSEEYLGDNGEPTVGEEDMELAEIAIAVQIKSSNTIDYLYRGYPLRHLNFAYQQGEGEGVRTGSFSESDRVYDNSPSAFIKLDQMSSQSVAKDEGALDEFLQEKGKGSLMQVKHKVQRNEEATTEAPHVPETPELQTPQPTEPHAASLKVKRRISDIVEDFLG